MSKNINFAMQPVKSSNISRVGYDDATSTLAVEFKTGRTFAYPGVKREDYEAMVNADSVGRHFHSQIRGTVKGAPVDHQEENQAA